MLDNPRHMFPGRSALFILVACAACLPAALPASAAGEQGARPAESAINDRREEGVFTRELADSLRMESNSGSYDMAQFDVAGFDRVYRIETPPGTFKAWNKEIPAPLRSFGPKPEYTLNDTYKTRIGGFDRRDMFSPDRIGKILSEYGVHYNNGSGNNLLESLMISKKYGLQYFFYAPDLRRDDTEVPQENGSMEGVDYVPSNLGISRFELPFVKEDMPLYEKKYTAELEYFKERLEEFSCLFAKEGGLIERNFKDDPDYFWALFTQGDLRPVDFFLQNASRDYDRVNAEFKSRYGFDLPLYDKITGPVPKARRIKMWRWVFEKFSEVGKLRADIFRRVISGRGILATNVHFAEIVDYERFAETFDYPGVAIRPMLSDKKLAWEYLMGFGTRFAADLTGKVPMVSVRINIPGSGARIIPTPATIEYWHSQAVQNGTVGFYLWVNDYPASEGAYRGPFMGNPDQSTLPDQRWRTSLKIAQKLSQTRVFVPPPAETAILVPLDSCYVGNYGWKRTFSAYIELVKAKVWCNFVSDQEIFEGTKALSQYKTIYVPFMDFAEAKVAEALLEYVRNGGTIISCDPRIFEYNLDGESSAGYRRELFGVGGVQRRDKASASALTGAYEGIVIQPCDGETYRIETDSSAKAIGFYGDGTPAVVEKKYGKGTAILFANPVSDIYFRGNDDGFVENTSRYDFYKRIETQRGIEDRSWVWDVNFHNVDQITGRSAEQRPAPLEAIKFKHYLDTEGGGPPTTMMTDVDPLAPDAGRHDRSGGRRRKR